MGKAEAAIAALREIRCSVSPRATDGSDPADEQRMPQHPARLIRLDAPGS